MPDTPNYSRYDVLAMYWQSEDDTNPSQQDILNFDAALAADNDATLVQIMQQEGVATDKSTKSTVLLLSQTGRGSLQQRILDACTFYKNTSG
jgi:hypothetical protein